MQKAENYHEYIISAFREVRESLYPLKKINMQKQQQKKKKKIMKIRKSARELKTQ